MVFNNAYFEDEVRDGFFVPSEMKRAWAAELEVLSEIDKICKNIIYSILLTGELFWQPFGMRDLYHGMMILILR